MICGVLYFEGRSRLSMMLSTQAGASFKGHCLNNEKKRKRRNWVHILQENGRKELMKKMEDFS